MEPNLPNTEGYTFEKVWFMFEETNKKIEESNRKSVEIERQMRESSEALNRQMAKTDEKFAQVEAQMAKTDAQIAKTDAQIAKSDKKMQKLFEQVSGIGNNNGYYAEDYFINYFKKKQTINGVYFQHVSPRQYSRRGKEELEFDIVLTNGNTVLVLEIKYKLHPADIEKFATKRLPLFRSHYPIYKDFTVWGGVAALTMPADSAHLAHSLGLFVFTPDGAQAQISNDKEFVPTLF